MGRILEKLRAILSTGLAGAALGALFGASLFGFAAIFAPGEVTAGFFLIGVALTGGVGAFIGTGFGALLALSARRDLEDLGLGWSALLGMIAGAAFPVLAAVITGGWLIPLELGRLAVIGGIFGSLGAALSAGLVAVAKGAEHPALESATDEQLLESGE